MRTILALVRRANARAGAAPGQEPDAGIAMVTALISILLTAMLSILLLGMLMSQLLPTSFLRTSSRTVFAAEAGINAVLGQLRNAAAPPDATLTVYGSTTKLPCTATGTTEGTSSLRYEASVRYYTTDPTGQSPAWLAANALACSPGSGPAAQPGFALITSRGIAGGVPGMGSTAGNRAVSVVYEFYITNTNTPGGLIYSYGQGIVPDRFCLEAYTATAGSKIKYVPAVDCGTNNATQLWIYHGDYQIKLASTTVPGYGSDELCITGPGAGSLPQEAILRKCEPKTSPARWNQLWSWEGGARWQGQKPTISGGYSQIYLYSGATSGSPSGRNLWVRDFTGVTKSTNTEWGSFNPDPRVGAGAAGYGTRQIVNYLEFGRCFDVTNEDPSWPYMIVYPCKQDPSGGAQLLWNHKWYYTEPPSNAGFSGPQQISVLYQNDPAKRYCLVSSGTEGGQVRLTSVGGCDPTANNQKWTRYADTGTYSSSYTFVDDWGRCASLGPKGTGAGLSAYSTITTTTCNAGLGQKWNAPPNTVTASLTGYQEIS